MVHWLYFGGADLADLEVRPTSPATNSDADAVSVMFPVSAEAVRVVVPTFSSLNGGHANVTAVMVHDRALTRANFVGWMVGVRDVDHIGRLGVLSWPTCAAVYGLTTRRAPRADSTAPPSKKKQCWVSGRPARRL